MLRKENSSSDFWPDWFLDAYAVARFKNDLFQSFVCQIGLDPGRLMHDAVGGVGHDLPELLVEIREGMGIAAREDRLRLGELLLVLGAVGLEKVIGIARIAEEGVADLVQLVGNQEFALLATLGPNAVIVRRRDDEQAIQQVSVFSICVCESFLNKDPRGRCRRVVILVFKFGGPDIPAGTIRLVRLEGMEKGFYLFRMIRTERVNEQMDVDLLLLFVDDIVCPQFDVRKEHLGRVRIARLVFLARGKITVGGEVIGNAKRLHIGVAQFLAVCVPHVAAVCRLELIVLLCAGRVEVEVPLPPLRSSGPRCGHGDNTFTIGPHNAPLEGRRAICGVPLEAAVRQFLGSLSSINRLAAGSLK